MRITTILARILALKQTRILAVHLEPEGVLLDVAPTTRVPFCSGCLKRVRAVHDTYEGRRWRHLDVAGMRLWLRYEIRRVRCPRCGVTVELVPWAAPQSWFRIARSRRTSRILGIRTAYCDDGVGLHELLGKRLGEEPPERAADVGYSRALQPLGDGLVENAPHVRRTNVAEGQPLVHLDLSRQLLGDDRADRGHRQSADGTRAALPVGERLGLDAELTGETLARHPDGIARVAEACSRDDTRLQQPAGGLEFKAPQLATLDIALAARRTSLHRHRPTIVRPATVTFPSRTAQTSLALASQRGHVDPGTRGLSFPRRRNLFAVDKSICGISLAWSTSGSSGRALTPENQITS